MENIETFTDEYGVVYSADRKRLIKAPDTLTRYNIPQGTEIIERKAFNNHWHLKEISFPSTLVTIGKRAFEACWAIDTPIILPDSVTELEPYCFSFCFHTPSITFGRNLKIISAEHLACCSRLREIIIPEENPYLRFVDGVLFNKEMTELIYHLEANKRRIYTVPSSVTVIRESAFGFCDHLREIVLPPNVKEVQAYAFIGCKHLARIVLPASITHIADDVFTDCEKLTVIEVPFGTKERFALMLPEWVDKIKEKEQ